MHPLVWCLFEHIQIPLCVRSRFDKEGRSHSFHFIPFKSSVIFVSNRRKFFVFIANPSTWSRKKFKKASSLLAWLEAFVGCRGDIVSIWRAAIEIELSHKSFSKKTMDGPTCTFNGSTVRFMAMHIINTLANTSHIVPVFFFLFSPHRQGSLGLAPRSFR